jgi:outer membrane receptor for ferrienterochelin and colicin
LPYAVPFVSTDLDAQGQLDLSPFEGNLLIGGCNLRWIAGFSDDVAPDEVHQIRLGAFVHDEQRLGDSLLLTAGVRFDYNSITPFTISPRAAGVWKFSDDQFLRLAFGRAFRKPTGFQTSVHLANVKPEPAFPELRDLFLSAVGNEDLENESITSLEAGYHGRFLDERLSVEAGAFYNRYRNTITLHVDIKKDEYLVPDLPNSVVKYLNTGREVDSLGGSVSVTYRIQGILHANLNYTYRYSWYISEPGGTTAAGEGGRGDRVSWEPVHLANLSCTFLPRGGLRLGTGWHGASSKNAYVLAPGGNFNPRALVSMPASWFLSAFLAWRVNLNSRWVELGVRAYNLLYTPYRDLPPISSDRRHGSAERIGRRIFFFFRGSI